MYRPPYLLLSVRSQNETLLGASFMTLEEVEEAIEMARFITLHYVHLISYREDGRVHLVGPIEAVAFINLDGIVSVSLFPSREAYPSIWEHFDQYMGLSEEDLHEIASDANLSSNVIPFPYAKNHFTQE